MLISKGLYLQNIESLCNYVQEFRQITKGMEKKVNR